MSARELVVLGTASQVPTRARNHNGYLLRWDREGILFDPGEGTQRQMAHAGLAATDVTRLCVTHFHGDHCLGVPGVLQRMSLDRVPHPLHAHYPAGDGRSGFCGGRAGQSGTATGQEYFDRLRRASAFYDTLKVEEHPIAGDGVIATGLFGTLTARALDHALPTFGYRLVEPDGRRMLPDRLAALGIAGPDVGRLLREGRLAVGDRTVTVEEVSEVRRGQRFAFVMDTRLCDNVFALAEGADLLVIEATYLEVDARLATEHGHLTAAQAARVAAAAGVRRLVLTHFSQRYDQSSLFAIEAAQHFGGDVVVAEDLTRVPVPSRASFPPRSRRS